MIFAAWLGMKRRAAMASQKRVRLSSTSIRSKKAAADKALLMSIMKGISPSSTNRPANTKNLSDAYNQLLQYRENLNNPPLLVVTDINNWEIHTNFVNTANEPRRFSHEEIASDPVKRDWLRYMFFAPERLHPGHNTAQVTQDAAKVFRLIADNMRGWEAETERIAYFLTKLVFCLFAEDIGLLPTVPNSPQGIFSYVIEQSRRRPSVFPKYVQNLFRAMAIGDDFLMRDIPYFNGTLFKVVTVEELQQEALDELAKAAELNWEAIEPSIFGTLFERSLDPDKRSQLGAHYNLARGHLAHRRTRSHAAPALSMGHGSTRSRTQSAKNLTKRRPDAPEISPEINYWHCATRCWDGSAASPSSIPPAVAAISFMYRCKC